MTNYSEQPGHVRCDQFRAGGKWYQTFQIDMERYYWGPSHPDDAMSAVQRAIEDKLGRPIRGDGMIYVVLEPYHEYAHPVMLGSKA